MLSTGAFNALLKTLEEPPPRVKFIFATTEYHKIPDTILSRCQQYDFRMIPARELQAHLRAGGRRREDPGLRRGAGAASRAPPRAARATRCRSSTRCCPSAATRCRTRTSPRCSASIDRELLFRASRAVAEGDSLAPARAGGGALRLRGRLPQLRPRARCCTSGSCCCARLSPKASPCWPGAARGARAAAPAGGLVLGRGPAARGSTCSTKAETDLRWAQDPRVTLELALLKLVQMRRLMPFAELVARVERLGGRVRPRWRRAPAVAARAERRPPPPRRPPRTRAPSPPRAAPRSRARPEPPPGARGRRRLGAGRDPAAARRSSCAAHAGAEPGPARPWPSRCAPRARGSKATRWSSRCRPTSRLRDHARRRVPRPRAQGGRPAVVKVRVERAPPRRPSPRRQPPRTAQRCAEEAEQEPAVQEAAGPLRRQACRSARPARAALGPSKEDSVNPFGDPAAS